MIATIKHDQAEIKLGTYLYKHQAPTDSGSFAKFFVASLSVRFLVSKESTKGGDAMDRVINRVPTINNAGYCIPDTVGYNIQLPSVCGENRLVINAMND